MNKTEDIKAYRKAYYEANKERILNRSNNAYAENREKLLEASKKRYHEKRESILVYAEQYRRKLGMKERVKLSDDERVKRRKETRRKTLAKHKNRYLARKKLYKAVRFGKVIKHPCFVCGCSEVEGHHVDYSMPLAVVWLCREHHIQAHVESKNAHHLQSLSKNFKFVVF